MKTHHPGNERAKRAYFTHLREAKGRSEASVDGVAAALDRFERYNRFRDFKAFHFEQAVGFKQHLAAQRSARTGEALSKATIVSTLAALKAFFQWLAREPGFKSKLNYADAEYFNPSESDLRIAKAARERPAPTLEQIHHTLASMPTSTVIERRDRAVVAFILLTAARDGAVASMRLKHVDVGKRLVVQDPREVKTKFAKAIETTFFPVGGEAEAIVVGWIAELREQQLFGLDDPLFPATRVEVGEGLQFEAAGVTRQGWRTAEPIRRIFKAAFERAGLPYFNPHSFRMTVTLLGEEVCRTPEEFKAWSQNIGHEHVLTTFTSYGQIASHRQAEIMKGLGKPRRAENDILARIKGLVDELD